jgi:hypothetical protein
MKTPDVFPEIGEQEKEKSLSPTLKKLYLIARSAVVAGVLPILASCTTDKNISNEGNGAEQAGTVETKEVPGITPGLLGEKRVAIAGDYPGQLYLQVNVFYENHPSDKTEPDEVLQFSSSSGFYNFQQEAKKRVDRYTMKAAHDSEMLSQIPIVKEKDQAIKENGIWGSDHFPPDGVKKDW